MPPSDEFAVAGAALLALFLGGCSLAISLWSVEKIWAPGRKTCQLAWILAEAYA
jgi:hypothetical protein